jgi:hypothetical protein
MNFYSRFAESGKASGRRRPGTPAAFKAVCGGTWEGDRGKHCRCFACGMTTMEINPSDKGGWAWFCTNRKCPTHPNFPSTLSPKGRRQPVVDAFRKAGLSLSSRPKGKERPPADLAAVLDLSPAERRVMAYLKAAADGSPGWIIRTYRDIIAACAVTFKTVRLVLGRLADAKLIGVRSNNYRLKRATRFKLLADPATLPFHTPKAAQGNTMERPIRKPRSVVDNLAEVEESGLCDSNELAEAENHAPETEQDSTCYPADITMECARPIRMAPRTDSYLSTEGPTGIKPLTYPESAESTPVSADPHEAVADEPSRPNPRPALDDPVLTDMAMGDTLAVHVCGYGCRRGCGGGGPACAPVGPAPPKPIEVSRPPVTPVKPAGVPAYCPPRPSREAVVGMLMRTYGLGPLGGRGDGGDVVGGRSGVDAGGDERLAADGLGRPVWDGGGIASGRYGKA